MLRWNLSRTLNNKTKKKPIGATMHSPLLTRNDRPRMRRAQPGWYNFTLHARRIISGERGRADGAPMGFLFFILLLRVLLRFHLSIYHIKIITLVYMYKWVIVFNSSKPIINILNCLLSYTFHVGMWQLPVFVNFQKPKEKPIRL